MYAVGYQRETYQMSKILCQLIGYSYKMISTEEELQNYIIARHFSKYLPVWVRREETLANQNESCNAIIDVRIAFHIFNSF